MAYKKVKTIHIHCSSNFISMIVNVFKCFFKINDIVTVNYMYLRKACGLNIT